MENQSALEKNLLKKLPESVCNSKLSYENFETAEEFLQKRLPRREIIEIEQELRKRFPLAKERQVFKKRIRRQGCPRKQELSNTKKRALGLFNISRKGLLYKDLLLLNQLWNQYIESFLDLPKLGSDDNINPSNLEELSQQLFKADFHGAYMEVIKSCCPNLVGIRGIVVFETRNIFKLLDEDNITRSVPKNTCEFKIKISYLILTFLGKNLLIRPADRSIKKIRNIKSVEL